MGGGTWRGGLVRPAAGEIMWAYTSPELYELLVLNRRWPPGHYGAFIADALIAALLPPGGEASQRP
jgi:hypothetical protein